MSVAQRTEALQKHAAHGGRLNRVSPKTTRNTKERSRRMALLRRAGLFGVDTKGAGIRRAITASDLAAAYQLVHETFVERGYIRPQPGGVRIRPFEALPQMATFIAEKDGRVVGVQGLAVDDPDMGLPSDRAFKREIDDLRLGDRLVCEATNQAIAPDYRKCAVATELMRAMFAHALLVGCDELITTVSPGHARFFELLGFERASQVRNYSEELEDETVMMRVNVAQLIEWVDRADDRSDAAALFIKLRCLQNVNDYCRRVEQWNKEAREAFADAEALRELFVERADLLNRLTQVESEAIRQRWSADVFDEVAKCSQAALDK